jgi:2-amino-4-hydroxy-6-hydroxymethyldihydropteridine diphosphokinase
MWTRAFVGLGSNIDHPVRHVCDALEQLAALPSTRLAAQSSLYSSSPAGPRNQPDFVNAAAELKTSLRPLVLLGHLQRIERQHGRVRLQRWGRRTLDLDLLLYDAAILNHPRLRIPHPLMHERLFVLAPLHDLQPRLALPGKGRIDRLLANLVSKNAAVVHRLSSNQAARA